MAPLVKKITMASWSLNCSSSETFVSIAARTVRPSSSRAESRRFVRRPARFQKLKDATKPSVKPTKNSLAIIRQPYRAESERTAVGGQFIHHGRKCDDDERCRDGDLTRGGTAFPPKKRDDVNKSDKACKRQSEENQKGLRILSDLKGLQNEF